ncbi:filamentous hemagglutinin N-terminal domain-containing protein [Microbulbifer thermotolerans]|uniref:filamentous hemagglutinin N-terminal domain-containing protein n=1 Tax=Microbulbifer thermotolerans TaxID=252514 RepID=UPI00224ABC82|nr:filamentous hemagglutinin N-terminal domain-containing protein [Microbulbifer thermotolerans]MCX2778240.1 filamentous hemagglutinin N-terminal domain-containing protein [Microbulbifer thermotolerans]MCX2804279.1 filamentous hemagglutinin N-terminal domain-containing protein [Microbulbifer thermotolerans]
MKAKEITLELKKLTSAIKVCHLAWAGLIAGQIVSPSAQAAPEGGTVVGGEGSINTSDLTTIIDQKTDLLAIDWESFNLTEEEIVKFLQPGSSSVVLNRILDENPSDIRGSIEANGHVILANPRGVLFTETATVNVGAITAAGLDINPQEFMDGNFAFEGEDGSAGVVVNRGLINAASAVLVGKQVTNAASGLISAEMVSLAAADEAVLTFDADGLIGVKVTKEVMENQMGLDSAVLNEGAIEGTTVLMEASVSGDLFTAAVNNEGTVQARGIDTSGGKIRLFGSGSGVVNSGTLDASGTEGGEVTIEGDSATHSGQIAVIGNAGEGGSVQVLGDEVTVSGDIDARGTASGGEVLIGGDYRGENDAVRNATTTTVTAEAEINASGIDNGDGGKVIVWADDTTQFGGTIRAESGEFGGDGGFVETSGKVNLHLDGDTMFVSTLSLAGGETGEWLLDPEWFYIGIVSDSECGANCISVNTLEQVLTSNNVSITVSGDSASVVGGGTIDLTDDEPYTHGIRVSESFGWSSSTELHLDSFKDIQIEDGVSITASDGTLELTVGENFINNGSIVVSTFTLKVGDNNNGSENTLGAITGSGTITGGAGLDKFTLTSADETLILGEGQAFSLNSITFENIEEVDTGLGEDSVTGADGFDWELTGTNNQSENNGITFTNVEQITAVNAGLTATGGDETFVVNDSGNVVVYDMTFTGLTAVDGNGGTDVLDTSAYVAGVTLTNNDNELSAGGTTFSNISSAVATKLSGTSNADQFDITGANSLDVAGISFSGLTEVDSGSGEDSVTGADGVDWVLIGTNKQAESSGITFSNIESVSTVNAELTGTTANEIFTLNSDGSIDSYGITFSGLTAIDGVGGSNTLNASAYAAGVALTDTDNQLSAGGITFSNIHSAVTTALGGSSGDDSFDIIGNNSLEAAEISFSGVTNVAAGEGNDSLNAIETVTLTGAQNTATTSGITFTGLDAASGGSLEASELDDIFIVTGVESLTANGIAFSGISSLDAKGGNDSVTGADGIDWELAGTNNQAENNGITFTNVEQITAVNAGLTATSGDETFVVNDSGSVVVYDMTFTGLTAVDGNGGTDALDASAYEDGVALTNNDNELSSGGTTFSNISSAVATKLTGTANADQFDITSDNSLDVAGISFSGLTEVDSGSGEDSVIGDDGADWTLTQTNNKAESSGITFSNIESVSTVNAGLIGTTADEIFVLNADSSIDSYGITFSGLTAVNGVGGSNVLDASAIAAGGELTGSDNELIAGGITFSNIHSAEASSLTATSGADHFDITGANSLDVAGISFSGLTAVDSRSGADSVTGADGADWVLTGTDNKAESSDITFSNIESVSAVNAELTGTIENETFVLNADSSIDIYGITFSGLTAVNGAGGSNVLDASVIAAGGELTGSNNELAVSGITFSDIHSAEVTALTGSSGSDHFEVTGVNALKANGIAVNGISTLDAMDGEDSVIGADGIDWILTGTNNQAENNGITFTNVEQITAVNAGLTATSGDETFVLNADTSVGSYGMTFTGLTAVHGNGGTDALDASAYVAGVTLTNNDNELSAGGTTFSNISSAVATKLTGTSNTDQFDITGDNSLDVAGIGFSGLTEVDSGSGEDSVTGANGAAWKLTGTNNQAESSGITFSNIESVSTLNAELTGTTANETFVLNADSSIDSYGMTFSGLTAVNGAGGSNVLDASAIAAGGELTGNDNELAVSGITFSDIHSAEVTALTGSSGSDHFEVTGVNALKANGIAVSGISTLDAMGGTDSVIGADGIDWLLTGINNRAENSGITFSNVESITALNAGLTGTTADETFTLNSDGTVDSYGMTFTGLTAVYGNGGTDALDASAYEDGVALTGEKKELVANGTTFSNIHSAVTTALGGSSGDDFFDITGDNSLEAAEISFSGVTKVAAGEGNDSLKAIETVTLTGAQNTATTSGITFTELDAASGGSLEASNQDDTFIVTGVEALTANGIAFSGISSLDAMDGTDRVIGADGIDWLLTGINKQAENSGITFSNVEQISAVNAGLTATDANEIFVVNGSGHVAIYDMTFIGLTAVDGNGGTDALDAGAYGEGVVLTGGDKELIANGITFTNIHSAEATALAGSSEDDLFTITGVEALTANGIAFSGISSLDAMGGTDSVIGEDGVDWLLTGINKQAENSGITFSNVELITALNAGLTGTAADETFTLNSDGSVDSYGITFSGLNTVDGVGGGDTLDASAIAAGVALTGTDNQLSAGGITFSNIRSAEASALTATSGGDQFDITGANSIDVAGISFSGLTEVDSGSGEDSVTGADGADWILTGTNNQAESSGITFTSIELIRAVNAGLNATTANETFVLNADGSVDSYGMTFSDLTAVHGVGGIDSLDASAYVAGGELTGSDNELVAAGIAFSNIHSAVATALAGSNEDDQFTITGTNALTANGIAFNDITQLDAMGGSDSVTGANGIDWLLTGAENQAENSGIIFSNVESITALNAGLTGTTADETFTLNSDGTVDSYNMTFTGLAAVDGNGGTDALDASAYTAGAELTGSDNELTAAGVTFSNIFSAEVTALRGSSGNDQFEVTGVNSLTANGIAFSEISSLDAMGGTDSVIGADGSDWLLTGEDNQTENSSITFTNVELITAVNAGLNATAADETFVLNADSSIDSYGMTFSGLNAVNGMGGSDALDASAIAAGGELTGSDNELAVSGITFSDIHSAEITALTGSSGSDHFEVTGVNALKANGIAVNGISALDAMGGTDSVIGADGIDWLLTGINNRAENSGITFSNVELITALNAGLTGTTADETFTLNSDGSIDSYGMTFTGLTAVDGIGGTDALDASAYADGVALADGDNQLVASGITFSNIFSAEATALRGSSGNDQFEVTGVNALTANGVAFSAISSLDAMGGTDSVIGADSSDWQLTGINKQAENSGITFTNVELITAVNAGLTATSAEETFVLNANGSVGSYGMTFTGLTAVDGVDGDDSLDASAYASGVALTGTDHQLSANGINFSNIHSAQASDLTGTSGADQFDITGTNSLDVAGISFSGLSSVDAGSGTDELAADGSVTLSGSLSVTASAIDFANIETVTNTGALTGTDSDDTFSMVAANQLDSYGIRFEGVNSVAAAAGSDHLVGLDSESWQLSGSDNALRQLGIDFTGLESTSGGNGILLGSGAGDQFEITADNQVVANSIRFADITHVDAAGGVDQVTSPDSATWILGAANGSAAAAGIDFLNIERVVGNDVVVDAATNNASDNFVLSDTGKALRVRGIDFSSVSTLSAGDDSGDSVTSNASEWLLAGTDGALSVNGVELSGIDRVLTSNALLRGTDSGETFALSGENALEVAAMAFEGISQVIAGGGSDLLQGTADADHFELADNGDISAAAINFSGIETVAAGEGEDTVGADGANWTSVLSGDALVEGSARATVNSIMVLFENLEQVNNADAYTGQDIDSEYTFSSLDTVTVAGVTFAGLSSFTAGSGVDVLRGADIDAQWSLDDEQGSITSGAQSMLFSGVESIVAGSGSDQFTLSGGALETLDTGAGNDSVQLAGTRLQALYLGEGDDFLRVDADSSQNLQLSGGSGDDEFQLNVAEKTWQINGANTRVGNFQLSGFEWLDSNTNSLALETDQNFTFVNGGDSSANFNHNGAGILFADSGLRLGYDGSGDISIISTGIDTITGDLKANRAALVVAGNVDIETDVNVLDIHSSVGDIDISVLAEKDLVIDEINAGRGNIVINSKSFGSLTAETYGDTHLTAGTVRLGDELQQWTVIGSAVNPLRMDVSESVDIVAISYFEPDFIRQIPAFSATGDELQSVAGAQTAQGLKSAVQNAVEDFAQVDPGIFTEVYPYSTGVDAVNTPEMRLKGDQLLPVVNQQEEDEEDGPLNRAAELGSISSGSRKGQYTGVGTVGAGR